MDKVVSIDILRINRKAPKKCTCKDRSFTVDTENREITCECGIVVDPFEALMDIAEHYERINRQHKELDEQRKQWLKEKPYSIIFKDMERHYGRGTMLPHCPKCEEMFDFKNITFWGNAEFYRKLEEKISGKFLS